VVGCSRYRSGRTRDWLKFKNSNAPAVKREAEEEWAIKLQSFALIATHCKRVVSRCKNVGIPMTSKNRIMIFGPKDDET
jgi:hypothetical protein